MVINIIIIVILIIFIISSSKRETFVDNVPIYGINFQSILNEKLSFLSEIPEKLYNQSKNTCDNLNKKLSTYAELINPDISNNNIGGSHHTNIIQMNQKHFDLLESLRHDNNNLYCLLLALSKIIIPNNNTDSSSAFCTGETSIKLTDSLTNDIVLIQFINLLLIYTYKNKFNPDQNMYNIISQYNSVFTEDLINKLILSIPIN